MLSGFKNYKHTGTVLYYGFRPQDSIVMHNSYLRIFKGGLTQSSYPFCFPPPATEEVAEWLEKTNKNLEQIG